MHINVINSHKAIGIHYFFYLRDFLRGTKDLDEGERGE